MALPTWHRRPRERRIRAFIFENPPEANAYFMLDAPAEDRRVDRLPANWSFGPPEIAPEAWIEATRS
jgi:hypothetical protein